MRRNELRRNANVLRQQLIDAGYDDEQIDSYLESKSFTQRTNMSKGIIGLFFQKSEFNIVPKALNTWKEFVAQRKQMREAARFVLNSMHHPLHGWFQRWKFDAADA